MTSQRAPCFIFCQGTSCAEWDVQWHSPREPETRSGENSYKRSSVKPCFKSVLQNRDSWYAKSYKRSLFNLLVHLKKTPLFLLSSLHPRRVKDFLVPFSIQFMKLIFLTSNSWSLPWQRTLYSTCSFNPKTAGGGGGGVESTPPPLDVSHDNFAEINFRAPSFHDFFHSSLAQLLTLFL